jgi:hypothetical protein
MRFVCRIKTKKKTFPMDVVLQQVKKTSEDSWLWQVYGMARFKASVTAELNCCTADSGDVWLYTRPVMSG